MEYFKTIAIGNIYVTLRLPDIAWQTFIQRRYGPFICRPPTNHSPCVRIIDGATTRSNDLRVSKTGREWIISRADFFSRSSNDLLMSELQMHRDRYSFDSWLRIYCTLYGSQNSQVLVHSAGYHDQGGVYIFCGRSGRGKSTITRLLGKNRALSDELVLVSAANKRIHAASTPFWGELKRGHGNIVDAPVRGIFFLRHGRHLSVRRIAPGKALRQLLPTILFFSSDRRSVNRILSTGSTLVERLPSYDLTFSLNDTKTDVLSCLRKTTTSQKEIFHAL